MKRRTRINILTRARTVGPRCASTPDLHGPQRVCDPGAAAWPPSVAVAAVQQPVVFVLHHFVALAGGALELRAIQDLDVAAAVLDRAAGLEPAGRRGDAFASHPKHVGD